MSIIFVAFSTVLFVELIGDRTLFAVATLMAQHRPLPILAGVVPALWLKMMVAVLLGGSLTDIPKPVLSAVTTLVFLSMAVSALLRARRPAPAPSDAPRAWPSSVGASFSAIALSEWGDPGQLAVVALAARFGAPGHVLLGACLAMTCKAVIASVLGLGVRRWLPRAALGYAMAAICLVLAIQAILGID